MKKQSEQKFSIRKYSVGIASVLVGSVLFGTGVASADTVGEYVTPQLEREGLIAATPEAEKVFHVVVIVNGNTVLAQGTTTTQTAFEASLPGYTAVEDADDTLERISATNDGNVYTFEYATKQAGDYAVEIFVDGKLYQPATVYPATLTAEDLSGIVAGIKSGFDADETLYFENVATFGKTYRLNYTTKVVEEVKEDFTIVTVIDGVSSTSEYTSITHAEFLEALSAITEANKDLLAGEVVYNGNKVTLNFTAKPEETSKHAFEIYVDGKLAGEISATDYTAEAFAVTVENIRADKADFDYVNYTAATDAAGVQVNKFYFATKVVEEVKEDFTLTVKIDGELAQVSEYPGITHQEFLSAVAAIIDGFNADGSTYRFEYTSSNDLVISVETKKQEEALEDFTLTVNIDGSHQQTSSYEVISYSKFLEVVAAIAEGLVDEGYAYDSLNWPSSNEAVLNFSSKPEETTKHAFEIYVDGELAGAISATEYTTEAYAVTLENLKADYATFDYSDWTVEVDADGVHLNKFYFITKIEAKGESTTEEPKPEFGSEKTEAPTVDGLSALRNELLKAIDTSNLTDEQKSDLAVKVAFAETEKELKAIKAEFDKLVAANTPAPKVETSKTETEKETITRTAAAASKQLPETGAKETVALVSAGLMLILMSLSMSIRKRHN